MSAPGLPAPATAHDKFLAAIGILQILMMARDSALLPEKIWGGDYCADSALQQAIALLIEITPDVENV